MTFCLSGFALLRAIQAHKWHGEIPGVWLLIMMLCYGYANRAICMYVLSVVVPLAQVYHMEEWLQVLSPQQKASVRLQVTVMTDLDAVVINLVHPMGINLVICLRYPSRGCLHIMPMSVITTRTRGCRSRSLGTYTRKSSIKLDFRMATRDQSKTRTDPGRCGPK